MEIIDAHMHVNGDHSDTIDYLKSKNLKLLNICVAHDNTIWGKRKDERYQQLAEKYPERYAWCTTFELPDFEPDYVERVLGELERDFKNGAVACKVWKNIGMEVRKPDGELLLVDDPLFKPIFDFLARSEKPLLMHIAEPLACWRPLSEPSPHQNYYQNNPEWHMYGRTDMPSHEELIASRDNVIEQNPDLRVVGAHLGSLDYDVAEVAKRLEKYPNFAVDISARLGDLMTQDNDTVRAFFSKYQDRILFGTDIVMREPHSSLSPEERAKQIASLDQTYDDHFRYFETDETVTHRGVTTAGVHLDDSVLEKFYRDNAQVWYQI